MVKDNNDISLVDIYSKRLDEFHSYVLGKHPASGVVERRKAMFGFARLFKNILGAEQSMANKILQHFIDNISTELDSYLSPNIYGVLETLKEKDIPADVNLDRFKRIVNFFIGLAENSKHVERYISGCDLPYLFKDWEVRHREVLLNFFCILKS